MKATTGAPNIVETLAKAGAHAKVVKPATACRKANCMQNGQMLAKRPTTCRKAN
jgi:hypothetical protein